MDNQTVDPKLPYSGKFWALVAPVARHYIKKLYGAEIANKALRGGKPIYRELKPGGTFCGCFYVQGEFARTDWFIKNL